MAKLLTLPAADHFGVCPCCGTADGHLNIGRDHWMYCRTHRVKWRVGHDCFPDWRSQTPQDWRQNERLLALFDEIEPARPDLFASDAVLLAHVRRQRMRSQSEQLAR